MLSETRTCDHCHKAIPHGTPYVEVTLTHNRPASTSDLIAMNMLATPAPAPTRGRRRAEVVVTEEDRAEEYRRQHPDAVPSVKESEQTMHFCDDDHLRAHLTG